MNSLPAVVVNQWPVRLYALARIKLVEVEVLVALVCTRANPVIGLKMSLPTDGRCKSALVI